MHLDSGQSFEGSLSAVQKDGLILRAAVLLGEPSAGQADTDLVGECFLPRHRVLFVQEA